MIIKSDLNDKEKEFLREEIQIIKLIAHPYIIKMRESFECEKFIYIVMDEGQNGELFEHIKLYEIEEKEIALIMYQLVEAIQYFETSGIVHRDLKPENILIEKDNRTQQISKIKITDFGLSKIVTPSEKMFDSCGTPAFVAPEVLMKKGY